MKAGRSRRDIHIYVSSSPCPHGAVHELALLFLDALSNRLMAISGISITHNNSIVCDLVLSSTMRGRDGRGSLYLELVEKSMSTIVWAARYAVDEDTIDSVASDAVTSLLESLHVFEVRLPPARRSKAETKYLKGLRRLSSNTRHDVFMAQGFLKDAIALDPNYSDAFAALSQVKYKKYYNGWEGDITTLMEAKELSEKALTLDPANEVAGHALVNIYWDLGLASEGVRVARKLIDSGSSGVEGLLSLILAHTNVGLSTDVLPIATQLLEEHSDDYRVQQGYIWANLWSGHYDNVVKWASRHIRDNPGNGEISWAAAAALYHSGAIDDAASLAEHSLHHSPLSFPLSLLLGYLYEEKGSRSSALQVWRRGLESMNHLLDGHEDNARLKGWRCSFYALLGMEEEAMLDIRSVEGLGAVNPYLLYKIFQGYLRLGRRDKALEALASAERGGFINGEIMKQESLMGFSRLPFYSTLVSRLKGMAVRTVQRIEQPPEAAELN